MLQGHFVDTMLADRFRDPDNWIYASWAFMRGITAPVFFFSSGLVFTYLLSKTAKPWRENERLFKGLTRVLQLLCLGYLLRLSLPGLLYGFQLSPWFWGADVLHVIALALLTLIGLFVLHKEIRLPLPLVLGVAGLSVFYLEPIVAAGNWNSVPTGIAGYFVNFGYSTFTILPWIGYTLIGGMGGALLAKRPALANSRWLPAGLLGAGLLLHFFSLEALSSIYDATGWSGFLDWRRLNSHLLIRLGDVWVVMALIIWITRLWKNMPGLIPKIGQETLLIYSVHYVVLFGTWFGLGIRLLGAGTWSPLAASIGAVFFVVSFILMIRHLAALEVIVLRLRRRAEESLLTALRGSLQVVQLIQRVIARTPLYVRLYRMKIRQ